MTTIVRKRIYLGLALLGVALVALLALRPDPEEVEAVAVRRAPLRVTVDAEGRARVRDRYVVAAPVGGRVERIVAREGDVVRAGDVVARIAPAPLDARTREQAEARVAAAGAGLREAGARLRAATDARDDAARQDRRMQALVAAGGVAPRDAEQARLALRGAEEELAAAASRVQAARAEERAARATLLSASGERAGLVAVRTPAGGRVLHVPDESERVVAPGTPLVVVGDPGGLEVVIDVLSQDAERIRPGAAVELEGGDGERPFAGTVREVSPRAVTKVSALGVDEQRVDVTVDLRNPPTTLGDGYRVLARILVWESPSALAVPSTALTRGAGGWQLFVVEDGRVHLRRVAAGHQAGAAVEVVDGIAEGAQVVVFPSDQLKDGVRVRVRGAE